MPPVLSKPQSAKLIAPAGAGGDLFFTVCEDGLELLRGLKGPLYCVAVAGKMRCGKSFILNLLSNVPGTFHLGHSTQSCTRGIDVCVVPHPSGGSIVLLDVEGMGSPDRGCDKTYDSALATLAALLSSLLVYNCVAVGTTTDVDQLVALSGLMQRVVEDVNDVDNLSMEELRRRYFPSLLYVLRDFSLEMTDADDKPCSSDAYLENVLLHVPPLAIKNKKKNERREEIEMARSVFPDRTLVTLPRPVAEEDDFKRLGEVTLDDPLIREGFRCGAAGLVEQVMGRVTPKQFDGRNVSGHAFANLVETLVASMGKDGVIPRLDTMWSSVEKITNDKALKDARKQYQDQMQAVLDRDAPMEDEKLREEHAAIFEGVVPLLTGRLVGDTVPSIVDAFTLEVSGPKDVVAGGGDRQTSMLGRFLSENFAISEAFCRGKIAAAFADVAAGILSQKYHCPGGYAAYLSARKAALDAFQAVARGPAAVKVFDDFNKDHEAERHLILKNDESMTAAEKEKAEAAEKAKRAALDAEREREEKSREERASRQQQQRRLDEQKFLDKVMKQLMQFKIDSVQEICRLKCELRLLEMMHSHCSEFRAEELRALNRKDLQTAETEVSDLLDSSSWCNDGPEADDALPTTARWGSHGLPTPTRHKGYPCLDKRHDVGDLKYINMLTDQAGRLSVLRTTITDLNKHQKEAAALHAEQLSAKDSELSAMKKSVADLNKQKEAAALHAEQLGIKDSELSAMKKSVAELNRAADRQKEACFYRSHDTLEYWGNTGYWRRMINKIPEGMKVLLGPKDDCEFYDRCELALKVLERDGFDADNLFEVAYNMPDDASVTTQKGVFNKQQCYVKIIEMEPRKSAAWNNLGVTLNNVGTVTLRRLSWKEPEEFTSLQCFTEALQLQRHAQYWTNIGITILNKDWTFRSVKYNSRQCYIEALELDDGYKDAWRQLGNSLLGTETIEVKFKQYTKEQCLQKGLK